MKSIPFRYIFVYREKNGNNDQDCDGRIKFDLLPRKSPILIEDERHKQMRLNKIKYMSQQQFMFVNFRLPIVPMTTTCRHRIVNKQTI